MSQSRGRGSPGSTRHRAEAEWHWPLLWAHTPLSIKKPSLPTGTMSSGHSHSLELLGRHRICHNPPPWKRYCWGPGSAGQFEGTSHRLGSWAAESGPVPGPCSRPRLLLWSLSQDTSGLRGPTHCTSQAGAYEPKHREEAWQAVVVWNSGCSGQHLFLTHLYLWGCVLMAPRAECKSGL